MSQIPRKTNNGDRNEKDKRFNGKMKRFRFTKLYEILNKRSNKIKINLNLR